MLLFLDTEWADPEGSSLVSLALVGMDDRYVFYAEREPLPATPTEFVREVVYPLLERGAKALPDAAFCTALREFIGRVHDETGARPTIAYDYPLDRQLFDSAWSGLDADEQATALPPVAYSNLDNLNPYYTLGCEHYFTVEPLAHATRHHALTDAYAVRAGYLYAMASIREEMGRRMNDPNR